MGASRQDLRRRVGELTGDLDLLAATATGSTTTFTDTLNLYLENSTYAGRFGFFSGGTAGNLYSTVRVTSNDKTTSTLTFTPAVAGSTVASDVLELYNRDGQGPKPEQIHRTINACIEAVSRGVLTEVLSSTATFDMDSPTLAIPATWRRLIAVEFKLQDTPQTWEDLSEAWLTVDRVGYTVRVDGPMRAGIDDYTVRLRGFTSAPALSSDTATTDVDAEWLVHEASSQILLKLATSERVDSRRAADYRATSQYLHTQANAFRSKVPTTIHSGSGWVLGGSG